MHAGKEGIASRGAALLCIVVCEECTFIADAIDVWCLSDHQPTVIDARLHPADVIAHDEEDVWLLSRGLCVSLCRPKPSPQRAGCNQHSAAQLAEFALDGVFHSVPLTLLGMMTNAQTSFGGRISAVLTWILRVEASLNIGRWSNARVA